MQQLIGVFSDAETAARGSGLVMTFNTVGGQSGNSPVAHQADSMLLGVKAAFQAG